MCLRIFFFLFSFFLFLLEVCVLEDTSEAKRGRAQCRKFLGDIGDGGREGRRRESERESESRGLFVAEFRREVCVPRVLVVSGADGVEGG